MVLIEIKSDTELDFYRANYPCLIVMFTADYCSKCRIMEPKFRDRADKYPRKQFLIVDCKKVLKHGFDLHAIPTFVKYVEGRVAEAFTGDDCGKLERLLGNVRAEEKLEKREMSLEEASATLKKI